MKDMVCGFVVADCCLLKDCNYVVMMSVSKLFSFVSFIYLFSEQLAKVAVIDIK